MATITGNRVDADPTQWFTLDYTFANSKFTWSVTAHASFTSYWNAIFGLTVNVGGNSYYKGDIDWRNYTPNTVVFSGTTNLTDCTITNGAVTLSVSGNFYYNTWNTDYKSSGSGTCAVAPPTVTALTHSETNKYGNMVVAGRSVITFTMKATSQTGSNTITYTLFQDNTALITTTGTSGSNKTVQVTAPSAGSHSYYYRATDGNGTTSTSGSISITTYAYTQPSFNSISAVRWTTGTSSGTASDEGTYCKATASWSVGKVGTTNLTTTLKVSTSSPAHSATTTTNGATLYLGSADYSPDNSYTVTFALYDNYTGEANAVKRTDTLTMGGRGLDFIYANGHYGIGIGQKAVANQFNSNLSTYIQGIPFGDTEVRPTLIGDGTVTGALRTLYGYGRSATYNNDSNSIMPMLRIVNNRTWANGNVRVTVGGRAMPITNIHIAYSSGSDTNVSIQSFWVDQNIITYLHKESSNTLVLYVRCAGSYSQIDLLSIYATKYAKEATTYTPLNDAGISTVPSGAIQATIQSQTLVSVTNTVTRSSGLTINWQGFRIWGRVACLELKLNGSGSSSAGSNIFVGTLPSYRPIFPAKTAEYYGAGGFIGGIDENGAITIRAISSVSLGTTLTFTWTYLWA